MKLFWKKEGNFDQSVEGGTRKTGKGGWLPHSVWVYESSGELLNILSMVMTWSKQGFMESFPFLWWLFLPQPSLCYISNNLKQFLRRLK